MKSKAVQHLANAAKRRRLELGLSVLALARKSGLPGLTISRIENGEVGPQLATLEKLARGLQTTCSQLVP